MANFFASIGKALARAFTIPAATRKQLDSNPLVQAALPLAESAVSSAISSALAANVKDPAAQAVIGDAISSALTHVFPASSGS